MTPEMMKNRTKAFGVSVIQFVSGLPNTGMARIIYTQLVRSATSVGANYRAACRAKSTRDFISKLSIVEEEADESAYWLEVLGDTGLVSADRTTVILREAQEIVAIVVSSINTTKSRIGGIRSV